MRVPSKKNYNNSYDIESAFETLLTVFSNQPLKLFLQFFIYLLLIIFDSFITISRPLFPVGTICHLGLNKSQN